MTYREAQGSSGIPPQRFSWLSAAGSRGAAPARLDKRERVRGVAVEVEQPSVTALALLVPGGWELAIGLVLILRLGLGLVGVLSLHLLPPTVVGGDWLNLVLHCHNPGCEALSMWQRWDALYYQQIAEHGYHAGDNTAAFYPLYPLLAHLVALPLMGNTVLAELLISSCAYAAGMWALFHLARLDVGPLSARLAVLLTALFPVGFFLLAPYAEGLYLCLTVAAFWAARRGRWWAAGLAGLGAGLTRPQGAILVLPLAFLAFRQRDVERRGTGILGFAVLPALGPILFTLYQAVIVGEARSGLQIEAVWGYRIVSPVHALAASWLHIVQAGDSIEVLNLVSLLVCTVLAIGLTRRLPIEYALYVWPYLALLYTRQMYLSPLMSVSRFVLVLFPLSILAGRWLARRPWAAGGYLVVSAVLQFLLFCSFIHFGFVG